MGRYKTPLRYPGGKQRLSPFVGELLDCNGLLGGHYAEPYAGGAGVALELLLSGKVSHIHLNDSSIHVYAFWHAIKAQSEAFCQRILTTSLTIEDWEHHREIMRHPHKHSLFDLGFSTFYLNRCNRSGILTAGVIGGFAQTGQWLMDARFPRNELIQRIETISLKADCISITNLDAENFICEHAKAHLPADTLVYCDPPYYKTGQRLYMNWYQPDDHVRLANIIQSDLKQKWIVSYDGHPDITTLYEQRKQFLYNLQYSANRAYKGREVFIFSDDLELPSTSTIPAINHVLEMRFS